MEDLSGLDWSAGSKSNTKPMSMTGTGNYYQTLRPTTPLASSGRVTPLSAQASGSNTLASGMKNKPATPDSFANLVSFNSSKATTTLTLQEQQHKLQIERAKKEAEQKRQYESQLGSTSFWDGQATKASVSSYTPLPDSISSSLPPSTFISTLNPLSTQKNSEVQARNSGDEDLFAAFNADTKVDNSSHYPPPSIPMRSANGSVPKAQMDLSNPLTWNGTSHGGSLEDLGDDDDPFGLRTRQNRMAAPAPALNADDEEDFLGDLGKPVEEVKRKATKVLPTEAREQTGTPDINDSDDPWDKAVAELVDMGFTAENSRRALTESGAGLDVQAAVGWLLNDAHRRAKLKSQAGAASEQRSGRDLGSDSNDNIRDGSADGRSGAIPPWMRKEQRDRSLPRRDDSRSPANSDSDVAKTAAAVGSNLLKTANSLWKTSQKKVQKAVAEFSQESDTNQPKWMRPSSEKDWPIDKQPISAGEQVLRGRESGLPHSDPLVTQEAMMLEADSRPPPKPKRPVAEPRSATLGLNLSRDQSPAGSNHSTGRSTPVPRWQQTVPTTALDAKSKLSKQAIEDQSAQAYVSPARRKKTTVPQKPVDEADLLFGDSSVKTPNFTTRPEPVRPIAQPKPQPLSRPQSTPPISIRPKAPPRTIPPLIASALASSTQSRLAGTAHFKMGDYAAAHASYSSSLAALPPKHPLTIVLLCNRSLTALKIGEPKLAVSDADGAIDLIGPSRGENETIDMQNDGGGEGKKDMKEFWGKALMRKAEALEQMERWSDAKKVWQEAVEGGVGGATAVQGRQRCEKALQPKPKPSSTPRQVQKPPPKRSALSDLAPPSGQSTEAVDRLRAANAAAEKADDEKFALSDSVDARISKWRDGRKDNLRALLGGMDQVLWEGSGWKKVGLHELVINGKVKINYMKAIAKVHPDKLPQDATIEMQMISAAVFSTLNEAWDKFKADNGL